MREMKNNDNSRSTTSRPGLVVLVVLSLVLAVLFVARPATWATPEQAPNWQLGTPTPTLLPTATIIPTPRPTGEPVPEPATILLLGGGTLGLGVYTYLAARRHRQKGGANGSHLSE